MSLFKEPLISGTLLKRYKRFLADVALENGDIVTCHCANTGSMKGVLTPPQLIYMSYHDDPKRKLKYTMQILEHEGHLVGVNTHMTNHIAVHAIHEGLIDVGSFTTLKTEQAYGTNSRIDILLEQDSKRTFIEVKNVSLSEQDTSLFPDSPTERGRKHLVELMDVVTQGDRAIMLYIAQRNNSEKFSPADSIDPEYGRLLRQAVAHGVEVIAHGCMVTPQNIVVSNQLQVIL